MLISQQDSDERNELLPALPHTSTSLASGNFAINSADFRFRAAIKIITFLHVNETSRLLKRVCRLQQCIIFLYLFQL